MKTLLITALILLSGCIVVDKPIYENDIRGTWESTQYTWVYDMDVTSYTPDEEFYNGHSGILRTEQFIDNLHYSYKTDTLNVKIGNYWYKFVKKAILK
jgi:hypothetical protein